MSYTLTTESDMPISVTALRDHCRIIGDDFDTQLTRAWYASSYDIEQRAGLLLRPCTVEVTLRGGRALAGFVLPVGPVQKDSLVVVDSNDEPMSSWYLDPNAPEPTLRITDHSDYTQVDDYRVTYSAGLAYIPNDLMVAALELTAHHFENREATAPIMLHAVSNSVWSIVANHGRAKV